MPILESEKIEFEQKSRREFAFLEQSKGLSYKGCSASEDDPRDAYVVAKYRQGEFRVDIVWDPFEMILAVRLRLTDETLGRREKFVHLEPFVEYVTEGAILPIVPQVYVGLSSRKLDAIMEGRAQLFKEGIDGPLHEVAAKLQHYIDEIRSASSDVVRGYHSWFERHGKN
jgi:hypothetical protein